MERSAELQSCFLAPSNRNLWTICPTKKKKKKEIAFCVLVIIISISDRANWLVFFFHRKIWIKFCFSNLQWRVKYESIETRSRRTGKKVVFTGYLCVECRKHFGGWSHPYTWFLRAFQMNERKMKTFVRLWRRMTGKEFWVKRLRDCRVMFLFA